MTDQLRELVINGRFLMQPTTGVQRVAREITREIDHLVANGDVPLRVRLVCEADADIGDLNLRTTQVERTRHAHGHVWEQFVLPRHVKGGRLLCLGNTAPIVTLLGRKPVALMIHDLSYRLFPDAYRRHYKLGHAFMLPFLLRRADPIVTVSETEKAMFTSLVPGARHRLIVAQNGGWRAGCDARAAPPPDIEASRGDYILYVGSLSHRKNIAGVLAVGIAMARERGIPLVLVGSSGAFLSPLPVSIPDDVKHLIRLEGQVEDLGRLGDLYRNARCLLFPSFYEASPLPPLEAMHFACPVVASDIPSMRERCGDAAAYCDPYDHDSIHRTVVSVLDDPGYARLLAGRGLAQASRYSWREQARTILAAIFDLQTAQPGQ